MGEYLLGPLDAIFWRGGWAGLGGFDNSAFIFYPPARIFLMLDPERQKTENKVNFFQKKKPGFFFTVFLLEKGGNFSWWLGKNFSPIKFYLANGGVFLSFFLGLFLGPTQRGQSFCWADFGFFCLKSLVLPHKGGAFFWG